MPATATVTVQRHAVSLALLPGVTGRSDVFAERREEVLAALRPALEAVHAPGGTVTVVAPALATRTTTQASPDLGASGYLPAQPGAQDLQPPHPPHPYLPQTVAGDPALHVTASAAVSLLRLAGWTREITTHELGSDAVVSAQTLASLGSAARSLLRSPGTTATSTGAPLTGPHLVIFACATADGGLPDGAPAALAEAEQRTHALYREVVALS